AWTNDRANRDRSAESLRCAGTERDIPIDRRNRVDGGGGTDAGASIIPKRRRCDRRAHSFIHPTTGISKISRSWVGVVTVALVSSGEEVAARNVPFATRVDVAGTEVGASHHRESTTMATGRRRWDDHAAWDAARGGKARGEAVIEAVVVSIVVTVA